MNYFYEQKPSIHSVADHYWHASQATDGSYPLYMTVKWGFVFHKLNGVYRAVLIGPRTVPTEVRFSKNEYIWGVVLHADVQLRGYAKRELLNQIVEFEVNNQNEVTIAGAKHAIPTYDQFDAFIAGLVNMGILHGAPMAAISHRDKQRKVKRYTGLTPKQIEQADRVDKALLLMAAPETLAEIANSVGFSDQSHMNRDFVRLVGYTPAEIRKLFSV